MISTDHWILWISLCIFIRGWSHSSIGRVEENLSAWLKSMVYSGLQQFKNIASARDAQAFCVLNRADTHITLGYRPRYIQKCILISV